MNQSVLIPTLVVLFNGVQNSVPLMTKDGHLTALGRIQSQINNYVRRRARPKQPANAIPSRDIVAGSGTVEKSI